MTPLPRLSQRGTGPTTATGAMKDVIVIQQRTGKSGYGQTNGPWTPVVTLFGKVEHLQGKENITLSEYAAETTDRITVPFVAGITTLMRAHYVDQAGKAHDYEILWPQNVEERGFFLELLCKEIFSAS